MPEQTFPGSIVHNALLKTGVIATYRILEGRINLAGPGNAVPNLASEGVLGGCSTRLAILALEIAAMGQRSTRELTSCPTRMLHFTASRAR
jgi:hypothetical protein